MGALGLKETSLEDGRGAFLAAEEESVKPIPWRGISKQDLKEVFNVECR
jgi:hypothetical protein